MIWLGMILIGSLPMVHAQKEECRLNLSELQPLILRFNPYFSNHQWNLENRMELARMGNERLLMITQDGCKRHHTVFTLVIDDALVENQPSFWINETHGMMRKVFNDRAVYSEFGSLFEQAFSEKYKMYGLGRRFNFPIGTRNFICEIIYQPNAGARIMVEMVEYIFKDPSSNSMRQETQPSMEDDGWLGLPRP